MDIRDNKIEGSKTNEFEEDPRYRQCNKESIIICALFFLNGMIGICTAYFLSRGPVSHFGCTLGMPNWVFYSVIGVPIAFVLMAYLVIRIFFKDLPLS